ncbi:MAG TPA: hypothetical protein VLV78_04125 [Thermoanaerobaculia bacterium]|nr:hypothetical protein [Thermoanaerobaculia bacterium]
MQRRDIHEQYDFFEYVRIDDGSVPAQDRVRIDVALLDMNHSWPNVGHDALVHAVLEAAEELREELVGRGLKVRAISYDVRRRLQIPQSPNGRFRLYIGTGGPGHLDPRQNDGRKPYSQGIAESTAWEAPLFHLFDSILADENAALVAVCHSFGLVCRWSGIAQPQPRDTKSSGMPLNTLTEEAAAHPWFSQFAEQLPDHRHFRVIDNRLFDLVLQSPGKGLPVAFESTDSNAVTMLELARLHDMPRILGVNHHPEIIDREHIMQVLEEKRAHGEVDEQWYRERAGTMNDLFQAETERQSRLTSHFSLLGPIRHHLGRLVRNR